MRSGEHLSTHAHAKPDAGRWPHCRADLIQTMAEMRKKTSELIKRAPFYEPVLYDIV